MPVAETAPTVRTLRRRFKPHKERFNQEQPTCPTPTRFHRACSWIDRIEKQELTADLDMQLVSLWIAFNALYGQWDEERREPKGERESWRKFIDRIAAIDRQGQLIDALEQHKRLVVALCEDPFISGNFWNNSNYDRRRQPKKKVFKVREWYREKRWAMVLDEVFERIYLMRCQLVHGAATYGSKLNRKSLKHCVMMLRQLLPVVMLVLVDDGVDEDWGALCYPPVE